MADVLTRACLATASINNVMTGSVADPGFGGGGGGGERDLSYTRAKSLFEARSGERGVGQGGGCPPSPCGRKWKSGNA